MVGLTGGIGAGKSTVAAMFATRGVPVIDADALAREVVAPGGPAHADVAGAWPEVIGPDGAVDRKRLGEIVFDDPAARKKLEGFTHPRIQAAADARLAALARRGGAAGALRGDAAGRERPLARVRRPHRRRRLARDADRARHGSRWAGRSRPRRGSRRSLTEEKLRVATEVIDNDGALAATEAQVEVILAKLRLEIRASGSG